MEYDCRSFIRFVCFVDVLGMIVEYDCRSFIQFVCRLSLEPNADPNEPGTERFRLFGRQSSVKGLAINSIINQ